MPPSGRHGMCIPGLRQSAGEVRLHPSHGFEVDDVHVLGTHELQQSLIEHH